MYKYQKTFFLLNTTTFSHKPVRGTAREEVDLESEFDCVYLRRERGKGVGKGVLGQSKGRGTGMKHKIGGGRVLLGKVFGLNMRSRNDEGRKL